MEFICENFGEFEEIPLLKIEIYGFAVYVLIPISLGQIVQPI